MRRGIIAALGALLLLTLTGCGLSQHEQFQVDATLSRFGNCLTRVHAHDSSFHGDDTSGTVTFDSDVGPLLFFTTLHTHPNWIVVRAGNGTRELLRSGPTYC